MSRRAVAGAALLGVLLTVIPAAAAQSDSIRDAQYWLDEYGITQAWESAKGEGVTVAVIDSGIDSTHPDLSAAVIGGTDVSGIGGAYGQKGVGSSPEHGTLVASLVAGRGHGTNSGVIGVAPGADLLSVSVAFGVAGLSTDDQVAKAVIWAVDNGADVINMSLTRNSPDWPESWDKAFLYAFENDVVVVAAAGNRSNGTTQVGAPATIPGVLTVAGVNRSGIASFNASSQGVTISVAAPSEMLVGAMPGGGYAWWEGTSGATPIVSGLVALVRSEYPQLSAGQVIDRITASAEPKGSTQPDPIYGHGLIDAAAAMVGPAPRATANPATELREWIRLYRRAPSTPTKTPNLGYPEEGPSTPSEVDPNANSGPAIWAAHPVVHGGADPLPAIMLYLGFATLMILLLIGAGRHFWRILRRE